MLPNISNKLKIVITLLYFASCMMFYLCYTSDKERFKNQLRVSRISRILQGMPSAHGDNGRCLLQKYNLYDASILKYVNEEPLKLDCSNIQPYLTYMDWNGVLHWNYSENLAYNLYMKCQYQPVLKKWEDDDVAYGSTVEIVQFPIAIKENLIRVKCYRNNAQIYINIHSHIVKPSPDKVEKNKKIPSHRPSVLLLLIDSLSRGQFIRALPQTYAFLTEEMGMVVFEGLNKVGDNTRPNTLALLTGLQYDTAFSYMPHMPKPVSEHRGEKIVKYDDDPVIWKFFREQGYFTLYGEEYLDTIFNYVTSIKNLAGFAFEPVDYYFRTNYLALTSNFWSVLNAYGVFHRYCMANERTYKYLMNYTEEFLTEMSDLKYFAFSFFVELSHEKLNDIKNMDNDLFTMLHKLFTSGAFSNTIVMVMGDHGHRFSGIRSTPIGRLEERMPFFGIHLPDKFKQSYPHIEEGLLSNKDILLSWYDIHSMLLDILHDNFSKESSRERDKTEVGQSIFRPVDNNRTCEEIGIPTEYCTCGTEKEIAINLPLVRLAATVLLDNINRKLESKAPFYKSKKEGKHCARLELSKIHSATLMASWHRFDDREIPVNVRVVISTVPGHAKFEGAVAYNENVNGMSIIGDINRINKYGNQSSCIKDAILRLYCYCI